MTRFVAIFQAIFKVPTRFSLMNWNIKLIWCDKIVEFTKGIFIWESCVLQSIFRMQFYRFKCSQRLNCVLIVLIAKGELVKYKLWASNTERRFRTINDSWNSGKYVGNHFMDNLFCLSCSFWQIVFAHLKNSLYRLSTKVRKNIKLYILMVKFVVEYIFKCYDSQTFYIGWPIFLKSSHKQTCEIKVKLRLRSYEF